MTQEPGGGGIKVKTKKKGKYNGNVAMYDSRAGWTWEFKLKLIKRQSK